MPLCWTSEDGPSGQQIGVQASALGNVRMVLSSVNDGIEPGSFVGQMAYWDGAAWVPIPPGEFGVIDGLRAPGFPAIDSSLTLSEGAVVLSNQNAAGLTNVNGNDVTIAAAATATVQGGLVHILDPLGAYYRATLNEHTFTTLDSLSAEVENLKLSNVADAAAFGALGAAPVVRQSITGGTQQAQINSVVSALSLFGFTQDDRPAAPSLQSQIGWAPNAAGQTSNLLTVLAAGHTPGLYLVSPHVMVRTLQAGSYLSMALTWSNGGAQALTPTGAGTGSALSITAAGMALNNGSGTVPRTPFCIPIYSDGVSAITVQFTSAGVMGGAALLDLYAAATCLGT